MAAGDVYADILTGRWTQAEFDANPDVILGNGQRIDLADDSGMFKLGDGARLLGVLPWLGGSSGTITLSNTKILVGNASNEAAEVSLTLSATPGAFALENTGELTMPNASPITRGLLSNSDWVTFNDKVPSSRSVSTSSPLSGGGILSGNLTLSISQSGASNDGFLSSFDWNTFNSKEPSLAAGTTAQYYRGDKSWQTLNTEVESVVNPLLTLKADLASPTFTGVTTFQNIIRLTSATPGTAVAGNIEFLTDKFYGVITTGTARKEFTLNDIALTAGRVAFTTTNGRITDSANLLFDTSNARLTIGSTTPPFQRDFVITKNNNGAVAFLVDNQSAGNAAFSGFHFICGTTTFSLVNYSQGYTGNFGNTNIAVASSSYFLTASRNAKLMFAGNPIYFITGNADTNTAIGHSTTGVRIDTSINIHNAATAKLHIGAGTKTAGTAPLKLTSGTNLTTPENGAFEYDGTNLYFTTGGVRKTVTLV